MRVEFEFDPPDGADVSAVEGVAVANCYDADGNQLVLYGDFGEPSSLAAIGLFTVGLRSAEQIFDAQDEV